jgi:hypothetical protein
MIHHGLFFGECIGHSTEVRHTRAIGLLTTACKDIEILFLLLAFGLYRSSRWWLELWWLWWI